METTVLQQLNFGLSGVNQFSGYDEGEYDNILGLGKKAKARRQEKREEKKQFKEDKRAEKLEKKELVNEKRRIKNELSQAQVDEKRANLNLLTSQGPQVMQPPPPEEEAEVDYQKWAIAGGIIVVVAGFTLFLLTRPKAHPAVAQTGIAAAPTVSPSLT